MDDLRITSVITPLNHKEWIKNAQTMNQKQLEKAVSVVNPQAFPTERIKPVAKNVLELKVAIDDATDKNIEILKALLSQRLKRAASLSDVVAWAAKETCAKYDPEKKAERSMKRKAAAPSSRMAEQLIKRKARAPSLRKPEVAKLASTKTGRRPIPAHTVHEVVQRDGHGCSHSTSYGRCGQRRWVDLHHVRPLSLGGTNSAHNLKFLCSAHHRLTHRLGSPRN